MSALAKNTSLGSLSFVSLSFSLPTFNHLLALLAVNRSLKSLSLRGSKEGESAFLGLMAALGSNQTLRRLDLAHCKGFKDDCAILLSQILQAPDRRSELCHLVLSSTGVGENGVLALTATPTLRWLELGEISFDSDIVCAMMGHNVPLPNLMLSRWNIGLKAAMTIRESGGRQSIILYGTFDANMELMANSAMDPSGGTTDASVSGTGAAASVIALFKKNAQLKHMWLFDLTMSELGNEEELAALDMYQTLNRQIPFESRKKLMANEALPLTEWCDTLGSVKNESLDCIYHVVSRWRLEGTAHYLIASSKRKSKTVVASVGLSKKARTD